MRTPKKVTHKKSRTKKKSSKKSVATKQQLVDVRNVPVHDFTYKQLVEASNAYSSCRVLWLISDMMERMKQGYTLNKHEIEAMDELTKEFNTLYKSPLAKAMREE